MERITIFVAGLLLLGGGLLLIGPISLSLEPTGTPTGSPSASPSAGSPTASPTSTPTACMPRVAISTELKAHGFAADEFALNGDVDWSKDPLDNTGGAFGGRLDSRQELSEFLRGDAPASRAARKIVLSSIPDDERVRALSGRGYTPVQFLVPVNYTGNLEWDGKRPISSKQVKYAKKGDVVWVYVTRDCGVLWAPSVRADCGNVSYHRLVPVRPGMDA